MNKQFFLFPIFNLDNEVGFMTLSALFFTFFFFIEKGVVLFFIWMLLIFCESRDGGGVELLLQLVVEIVSSTISQRVIFIGYKQHIYVTEFQ